MLKVQNLTSLLGATLLGIFLNQMPILALSTSRIAEIAENITVLIKTPAGSGSGVIIAKKDQEYRILTAAHVVDSIYPGEEAEVITVDGLYHPIDTSRIKKIPNIDLAVIYFNSTVNYSQAELGDSEEIRIGEDIYVSGFPLPTAAIPEPVFAFTEGKITSPDLAQISDGYTLIYTNKTLPGMSGGAVLNDDAELIGIHGRADAIKIDETEETGKPHINVRVKSGFNLGIPINFYLNNSRDNPPTTSVARNPALITSEIYEKLQNFLEAGKWRDADLETSKLILKYSQREEQGFLNSQGIKNISCQNLRVINKLWNINSRGRFGFTVQKFIWTSLGGKLGDSDQRIFERFSDAVGWRFRGSWLSDDNLKFSIDAPKGHLPKSFLDGPIWGEFLGKVKSCQR